MAVSFFNLALARRWHSATRRRCREGSLRAVALFGDQIKLIQARPRTP